MRKRKKPKQKAKVGGADKNKSEVNIDWQGGYWSAAECVLQSNFFEKIIPFLDETSPCLRVEHGALVTIALKKGAHIAASRAVFEPTTSSVQFLLQGLINWSSREFGPFLLPDDLVYFNGDEPDTQDSVAQNPNVIACAADVINVENSNSLKKGVQKTLAIIFAKVLSQTPFGIRKIAGLLLKDKARAFRCGKSMLSTWRSVISLERYGHGIKNLIETTARVRSAQPYRYAGLLLEREDAVNPLWEVDEDAFGSDSLDLRVFFSSSMAFAESIYARGFLQTKNCYCREFL